MQEQVALLTAAMRLARMAETLTATCMEAEASPMMNTGFCSGKLSASIARAACGMSRATNAGAACIREWNASRQTELRAAFPPPGARRLLITRPCHRDSVTRRCPMALISGLKCPYR